MKHLYKVITPKKILYTTAAHVPHLYDKLKKDFGIYTVTDVIFIDDEVCPICGKELEEVMGDGANFEYDVIGYKRHNHAEE